MRVVDYLVIGGGIAGLRAAAGLADSGSVLVVTKEGLAESNTAYAQGGIAVAMGGDEDVALHLEDTVAAGDGLVDREAAAVLVSEGPRRVEELLQWGTQFDRSPPAGQKDAADPNPADSNPNNTSYHGDLMRTREGAHSLSRILHANGDATGREIAVSLLRHVRGLATVELTEWTTTIDLVLHEGRVVGVSMLTADGATQQVHARAVLLATGGAGQVYAETTNPAVATGDGIAMAYRAGAQLMDMEFYQFHPTAFALLGAPRFLMSEALRGEGALLINARGERFMHRYHPGLELAPRDVVARAIAHEAIDGPVYLDMREVGLRMDMPQRFPGISRFLAGYGLALANDLIPVLPAAHYLMGGIRTDTHGRTSLPGLYAAGEAACTGVHGANRLASNSLLEGLVFGALAAEAMLEEHPPATGATSPQSPTSSPASSLGSKSPDSKSSNTDQWVASLRQLMWRDAGLLRDGSGLKSAQRELHAMRAAIPQENTRKAIEARNLHTLAEVIVQAALGREESRGAHYRTDYPQRSPVAQHSIVQQGKLSFR